ncbi:Kmo [Scenedesmus sp. PABB004]|nr:Kmo [Scenedesmus sp. PABB004]
MRSLQRTPAAQQQRQQRAPPAQRLPRAFSAAAPWRSAAGASRSGPRDSTARTAVGMGRSVAGSAAPGGSSTRALLPAARSAAPGAAAALAEPARVDALIVGGGPAGLAAAVMLAGRGWTVAVAERNSVLSYSDPDRSYVYAIDGRGRAWTDRFGVTQRLAEAAVDTKAVEVARVFPDGATRRSRQLIKDEARAVHWLPRSAFLRLLEARAREDASFVQLLTNTEAVGVSRGPALRVTLRNTVTGNDAVFEPRLLIGCDGIASLVRGSLQGWAAADGAPAGRFAMSQLPSLSTGLRFKVLQLPPNPAMRDGAALANPSFCLLAGKSAPAIGGPPLRLGLLPIKDVTAGRTANLITLPDHPVWSVQDAETMYTVFEQAFPQADWRALVPETVMAKFAASRGGAFPAPQFSQGLATVVDAAAPPHARLGGAAVKGIGVVLLGDAAHAFPPDLGQGVNSALEDVLVLERQLEATGDDLGAALPAFEVARLPDSAALAKLVQVGFPLQYNQFPVRRVLWNLGFLAQVVLHKVLPFLVSPPLFIMVQDPARSYSSVLAATQRSRAAAAALGAAALAALAALAARVLPRLAAGLASGGAAA